MFRAVASRNAKYCTCTVPRQWNRPTKQSAMSDSWLYNEHIIRQIMKYSSHIEYDHIQYGYYN